MSNATPYQELALQELRRRTAARPRFAADPDQTKILWVGEPANLKESKAANNQHQLEAVKAAEAALQTDALASIAEQLAAIKAELTDVRQAFEHYSANLVAAIQLALDSSYRPTDEENVPL
jgi:hypothetical protein